MLFLKLLHAPVAIYLAVNQAYWFVVLQTLQEYAAPPITHCPFVLFSPDALTFRCSSEHQQGMHFRKSQARWLPLWCFTPTQTHFLRWTTSPSAWIRLRYMLLQTYAFQPSSTTRPLWILCLMPRESAVNILLSTLICLKLTGGWLAKQGGERYSRGSK